MKFLLDSGDPDEYRAISALAKEKGGSLWGSTTNPTLIAKKLAGQKITGKEAFALQKKIVLEILDIVPGAVSAEVYADEQTSADSMIEQGREIATWHDRVVVKLPTTIEGFIARTVLRKEGVLTNNTLVFSQEQVFAICLHEEIMQKQFGPIYNPEPAEGWPPFISPFVGRLDDIGEDGMTLVENGMKMKQKYKYTAWMLEASVRRVEHIKRGEDSGAEIVTSPAKIYQEWFTLTKDEQYKLDPKTYAKDLKPKPYFDPPEELRTLKTIDAFMEAVSSGTLNIKHDLTDKGIVRFADDWKAIIKT